MNNTTMMSMPLNQITQSIKTECKTENSINIPYFFSTIEKRKNSTNITNFSKKTEKKQNNNIKKKY